MGACDAEQLEVASRSMRCGAGSQRSVPALCRSKLIEYRIQSFAIGRPTDSISRIERNDLYVLSCRGDFLIRADVDGAKRM